MPKTTRERKHTTYVALTETALAFLERTFSGKNTSQRLSAGIVKLMDLVDDLKNRNDAILAYRQTEDEHEWGNLPFEIDKKSWKNIPKVANVNGYVFQVVENKEKSEVTVYIAPRPVKGCSICARIKKMLDAQ